MFWEGLKAGCGVAIGYIIMRSLVTIGVLLIAVGVLCYTCVHYGDDVDRSLAKLEKTTKLNIVDPKWGYGPGDEVVYPTDCNVRREPTEKSRKIGRIKKGVSYYVVAREHWNKWRLIQTKEQKGTDKALGWVGCYP